MAYEAYWAQLNWTALAAFAGGIGTFASPFLMAWWKDKSNSRETAAKLAETTAERVERQLNEAYERAIADRQYQAELAAKNATALLGAQNQANDHHRDGRGMEDWAHWYRHGWLNMMQRFFVLVDVMEKMFDGRITSEGAKATLERVRATMPEEPPTVPLLQDAFVSKPPRP